MELTRYNGRRCGECLLMCCKNGRYDVADDPRRPVAVIMTNELGSGTPSLAWKPQNEVNAASLRFTLAPLQ